MADIATNEAHGAENSADSHSQIAVWLAGAMIAAGVLDAVSTELALATGQAMEANPVVRGLQSYIGSYWVVPKMIVHFTLAYVILCFPTRLSYAVFGSLTALTFIVAFNNFDIYFDIIARSSAL